MKARARVECMGSFFFREIYKSFYEEVIYMSDRIIKVMEKYNVDLDEALDIIDMEDGIMKFIHNYTNPYGKTCH